MFKLYTDAATMNNSGNSSCGILIVHDSEQYQEKLKLTSKDNHEAEFEACLLGFKAISPLTNKDSIIVYYTDSKIVHESLEKQYAKHYQEYVDQILEEQSKYSMVINNWIPDTKNEGAHNLATQALHLFY
ncbi:ribonuclease HI [Apilactobacillus kunkeei]|uniref:Ribonuclease HI n=1 Tax=Apilactobacillus kunkeei TaxID=148814 RepID=A0AAC8ZZL8_9LACO|nr:MULTISPECIES: ribonuclease HI family protein [Apilactobacillus]ALJ31923.1 ribonuclease HI [Apilactobacillus kunkeei]KFJ15415.1 ribonuclease HI [Apilactobacillus kunkeei]KOY71202.1 putative ribonuclease H [Apilactobacillus kunkeei]MCK8618233.1 ribonuclease HI family protein [Apilactobacillus kunkeei]MCT6848833.1 ribonuclease HI family protein [Apilactobacillus kunkeei]